MKKTGRTLTWISLALFPSFAISAQVTIGNYSTDITGDFGPRKIRRNKLTPCLDS